VLAQFPPIARYYGAYDAVRNDILRKLSGYNTNDIAAANVKLDALLINRDTINIDKFNIGLRIAAAGLAVAVISLLVFSMHRNRSFVIFNDESKRRMDSISKKWEIIKYVVGVSFLVGTGASIAATFIYNFFSR
jgi:hypothetical protein